MTARRQRHGFALVELLAALVVTAILLLLVGSLLEYGTSSWGRSSRDVAMRDNADAVMSLIAHRVHTASLTNITVTANSLGVTPATFQLSGHTLTFTPTVGGSSLILITNTVQAFAAAVSNGLVTVHLCVTNGINKVDLYANYKCRN